MDHPRLEDILGSFVVCVSIRRVMRVGFVSEVYLGGIVIVN